MQRPFGGEVETALETREDAHEQVMQTRPMLRLRLYKVTAAPDEQPDLGFEFGAWLDRTQIGPGADLLGDSAGIPRVGLAFAPTEPGRVTSVNVVEFLCGVRWPRIMRLRWKSVVALPRSVSV